MKIVLSRRRQNLICFLLFTFCCFFGAAIDKSLKVKNDTNEWLRNEFQVQMNEVRNKRKRVEAKARKANKQLITFCSRNKLPYKWKFVRMRFVVANKRAQDHNNDQLSFVEVSTTSSSSSSSLFVVVVGFSVVCFYLFCSLSFRLRFSFVLVSFHRTKRLNLIESSSSVSMLSSG